MRKKVIEFDELEKLPDSWEWVPLEKLMIAPKTDIVDGPFGSNLKASEYKDAGIPIARLQNIDRRQFVFKNIRYISPKKAEELDRHNFMPGDVLITKLGAPLGKACIAPKKIPHGVIVADLVRVRIRSNCIYRDYLTYAINSPFLVKQFERHTKGTTRPRVNLGVIRKLPIPVAPPKEQKRIVAEIEKQFSRLDEAVDNLKRVKVNLKRYKASVLKAAVEGKLTEEWRKEHPDVEPADKLLERILAERRKRWEETELAKMKAKGKVPKDDKWKKKYKEPPQVDASVLPELPVGWTWANFERLAEDIPHALKAGPFGSSLKKAFYVPHGYKIYGQEQVLRDNPSYGDYYIDEERYEKLKNCSVKPGDILISLVGTIGKVLILPEGIEPGIINPRLVKLSLDSRFVDKNFIKIYLQSPYVKYLFSIASHGGTMDILNLTILKEIPIPVPPMEEQKNIIEELERIFSIEMELNTVIESNFKRSERFRQSLLKNAFSGKLVPQNSSDKS